MRRALTGSDVQILGLYLVGGTTWGGLLGTALLRKYVNGAGFERLKPLPHSERVGSLLPACV